MNVLVVDDEQDIVELIAYNLVQEGFDVLRGYDGGQALTLVRAEAPDPVILDLVLPMIPGLEVCRRFRKDPRTAGFLLILFLIRYCF